MFHTITGRDFGRSIRWSRTQPRLRDFIMKPKLIQLAQFSSGAGGGIVRDNEFQHLNRDIIHGAVIEIGTVRFESARPTSAANAEFINRVAEEACRVAGA
jgi:hypothetical protein